MNLAFDWGWCNPEMGNNTVLLYNVEEMASAQSQMLQTIIPYDFQVRINVLLFQYYQIFNAVLKGNDDLPWFMVIEDNLVVESMLSENISVVLLMGWGKTQAYLEASALLLKTGFHIRLEVAQPGTISPLVFSGLGKISKDLKMRLSCVSVCVFSI